MHEYVIDFLSWTNDYVINITLNNAQLCNTDMIHHVHVIKHT